MATVIVSFIVVLATSFLLTGAILKLVIKNKILDYPGSRSLHDRPLPRGGGIAIAILVLLCQLILWQQGYLYTMQFFAFFIGGSMVFVTGLLDDIRVVPTLIKGVSYFIAALWGVSLLEAIQFNAINMDAFIILIWSVFIAWGVNLYNFMDGSDGLAGMQTFLAGGVIAGIAYTFNMDGIFYLMIVIAASLAGFLFYNLPPAKLFMGDSGSCFIGFMFGMTGCYSIQQELIPLSVWLILFSVFICDSGLTLLMRIISGKRWYRAHKEHAYQRLILMGHSHGQVLLYFTVFFLVFLFPMTITALMFGEYAGHIIMLCYLLLVMIWGYIQYQYQLIKRTEQGV